MIETLLLVPIQDNRDRTKVHMAAIAVECPTAQIGLVLGHLKTRSLDAWFGFLAIATGNSAAACAMADIIIVSSLVDPKAFDHGVDGSYDAIAVAQMLTYTGSSENMCKRIADAVSGRFIMKLSPNEK